MRKPSTMIGIVLAVVALMVLGMVAATFGGLWMIERVPRDPTDAVLFVVASILWMVVRGSPMATASTLRSRRWGGSRRSRRRGVSCVLAEPSRHRTFTRAT